MRALSYLLTAMGGAFVGVVMMCLCYVAGGG